MENFGKIKNTDSASKSRTHNLATNKQLRRDLRNHSTVAEATLWKQLKAKQILGKQFRRQFSIGPYVLDFYCPEAHLAIELDGHQHFTPDGEHHDTNRSEYLMREHNIRILRFENHIVYKNLDGVIEIIKKALSDINFWDTYY